MSENKKPVPIRLDDRHLEVIDELRRVEKDIPTRSEMVRRLIERAGQQKSKPAIKISKGLGRVRED